jgi:ubiquitin C-terminal hydrolase
VLPLVNLVLSLPLRSYCLLACALSHPLVIRYPTVYHDETYFVVVDPLRQPLASKSDRRPVGTLHNDNKIITKSGVPVLCDSATSWNYVRELVGLLWTSALGAAILWLCLICDKCNTTYHMFQQMCVPMHAHVVCACMCMCVHVQVHVSECVCM